MSVRLVVLGFCSALLAISSCEEQAKKRSPETETGIDATESDASLAGGAGESGSGGTGAGEAGAAGAAGNPPLVPPTELELKFVPIALNLKQTTDFDFFPGKKDEILAIAQNGTVRHLRLTGEKTETLGSVDIPNVFYQAGCGLLSLAFDPKFQQNKYLFMGRCLDTLTTKLARFRLDPIADLPSSEAEIITLKAEEKPKEDWHRWGSLGFEPDGTMWALLGDLFVRTDAQDTKKKPGSLLRFIPNRSEGGSGYLPAKGNAFSDEEQGDLSVYAYGFRSPWRGVRDKSGRYWVGDVGEYKREEIDFVTKPGQNFGWDVHEGPCASDCESVVDPVVSWGRTSDDPYVLQDRDTEPNVRRAAWIAAVYEETDNDRYFGFLNGFVMYGDFYAGWVRGLKLDAQGKLETDRLLGHLTQVTAGRVGPDGYIYLLTLGGTLYRVEQVLN